MAFLPHQGNNAASPQPHFPSAGPVAIGRFVAPVAGKMLSRGGAATAALLDQWAAIAGPALAPHTLPAKLTKAAPNPAALGENVSSVLLLKVDPAKALEVQYAIPQLIERVNQALGYKAIAGVRLVQVPFTPRAKKRSTVIVPAPQPAAAENANRLGNALARMARGVQARGAAS
jgi:hypothetical protein